MTFCACKHSTRSERDFVSVNQIREEMLSLHRQLTVVVQRLDRCVYKLIVCFVVNRKHLLNANEWILFFGHTLTLLLPFLLFLFCFFKYFWL